MITPFLRYDNSSEVSDFEESFGGHRKMTEQCSVPEYWYVVTGIRMRDVGQLDILVLLLEIIVTWKNQLTSKSHTETKKNLRGCFSPDI